MLDLSNLSWSELDQLSDFFQTIGRMEESIEVSNILLRQLEEEAVENWHVIG